jgi:outer membrane protein
VIASWAVFDSGRTKTAVAQARAQAEAARFGLADLERRIRFEVTGRRLEVDTARASVGVADRSLQSASENLRVSKDRYRAGVLASSDLLDAEVDLLRAGLARTGALARLRIAEAGLERAVGK